MAQSLARLHIHLIFSTKERKRLLTESIRMPLHAYMTKVLVSLGCPVLIMNSVEDHVHILFDLARTVALSDVVEDVKKSSSKWMKSCGPEFAQFAWQAGYGAFAVSESHIPAVQEYIAKQQEHHRRKSFQEEFRSFLDKNRVTYDERYLWD